ncbi:T9SS type A sorting domain-containing protein [Halocola ammonii]
MSKLYPFLLLTIIITSSSGLLSQTPSPESFPESDARWINAIYSGNGYIFESTNYCMDNEDTLINELSYSKLDTCLGGYKGALRSNLNKVYFVPKDSTAEFLLYDFGAQTGDTIQDVYFESDFLPEVFLADVLIIGGNPDAEQWLITIIEENGNQAKNDIWKLNIGSVAGLFSPPWDWLADGGYPQLICFSTNDSIFHPMGKDGPGQCALDLSIEKNSPEEFSLYPNPTSGEVTLNFPPGLKPQEIEVRNAMGRVVQSDCAIHGSTIKIDLSHLSSGMYFLNLRFEGEVISKKIIKN